jgi:hypothetical protein
MIRPTIGCDKVAGALRRAVVVRDDTEQTTLTPASGQEPIVAPSPIATV